MLETVQFEDKIVTRQYSAILQFQNKIFLFAVFFFQTRFAILGKVLRNVSSVCVNIYFSFFKILPEEFFLENPGSGNMSLITRLGDGKL